MTYQKQFKFLIAALFVAASLVFLNAHTSFAAPETTGTTQQTVSQAPVENQAETSQEAGKEESEGGVLGMLGINWKLFIAQLINFGIVLFVLWKWVFKPVSSGLEARTTRIEKSLQDATQLEQAKKEFDD